MASEQRDLLDVSGLGQRCEIANLGSSLFRVGSNESTDVEIGTSRTACFSVRLNRAVSPSRPDHHRAPRAVAVKDGRKATAPCAARSVLEGGEHGRSEEHTSELQSRRDLVCRLLLEKKKKKNYKSLIIKKKKKKRSDKK